MKFFCDDGHLLFDTNKQICPHCEGVEKGRWAMVNFNWITAVVPKSNMFGHNLRYEFKIGERFDLWLECNLGDVLVEDKMIVNVVDGMSFYSAKRIG